MHCLAISNDLIRNGLWVTSVGKRTLVRVGAGSSPALTIDRKMVVHSLVAFFTIAPTLEKLFRKLVGNDLFSYWNRDQACIVVRFLSLSLSFVQPSRHSARVYRT